MTVYSKSNTASSWLGFHQFAARDKQLISLGPTVWGQDLMRRLANTASCPTHEKKTHCGATLPSDRRENKQESW